MNNKSVHSAAFGLATKNSSGELIEVFYPDPQVNPAAGAIAVIANALNLPDGNVWIEVAEHQIAELSAELGKAGESAWVAQLDQCNGGEQAVIFCLSRTNSSPVSIAEGFLKLHVLSHRLAKPHDINLEGIFGVLKNLAWTNQGAIELEDLPARQLAARRDGSVLDVIAVDKFPKMTNYVVPAGVRIADTARVRLGAYIGEGTTVMHEGFVNFNAGTLGTAMVEGRISAGVVVEENSDLGGGCSTMGTLSGGGTAIISVGKNCLIGANAGIGFPLPDGCIVEAGLYVTGGTKVNVIAADGSLSRTVKAANLSTTPDLLYRRNSLSGAVEAVPTGNSISLNKDLHHHN